MQVLDVQQSSPTPYTPAGGTYNNNPVPGAGGLPSLSGLNNRMNPMAQELQGQGRGEDKMLVHMTPDEVSGLQALAMHHGTSLTINPNTGLPEAGALGNIFKKLLPALLGAGLAATGIGAPLAAGLVGIGQTALTGSLKKGLMAGLGAFGGASLAGAAGLGGSISNNAFGVLGNKAGVFGANMGLGAKTAVAPGVLGTAKTQAASNLLPGDEIAMRALEAKTQAASNLLPGDEIGMQLAERGTTTAAKPGFFKSFGQTASRGLPGVVGKAAPMLAASGVFSTVADVDRAIQQGGSKGSGPVDQNNFGLQPYRPIERRYNPRLTGPNGEGEIDFFEYINAPPGYMRAPDPMPIDAPRGFASGGSSYQPPARQMSADEAFAKFGGGAAKPLDQRQEMLDYAADLEAYRLMTEGMRDAQGNQSQFSGVPAGQTVGTITTFGGKRLQLGEDMRWRTIGDALPVSTSTPTPTPTPTPTTTGGGLAALPASEALRQINPDPNKLSNAYQQNRLGATLLADMPRYTEMYETSPGPITASLQYPGGSFNDQIRAQINAREAARTTSVPDIPGPTPQPQGQGQPSMPQGAAPNINIPTPQPQTIQDYLTDYYKRYGVMPSSGGDIPPGDKSYRMGGVHMDNGAFVVDARTVSELGNGSSNAGKEYLRSLGGLPVNGPGDGVSDSIRANIGGVQEARIARDEVIFPAKAVKRMGGANKLYALMDMAHAARKKADRGEDTKLRSKLSAL